MIQYHLLRIDYKCTVNIHTSCDLECVTISCNDSMWVEQALYFNSFGKQWNTEQQILTKNGNYGLPRIKGELRQVKKGYGA